MSVKLFYNSDIGSPYLPLKPLKSTKRVVEKNMLIQLFFCKFEYLKLKL